MEIQRPFETRRHNVDRVNAMGVKTHTFTAKTLVKGVGSISYDIPFPILFTDEPGVSFGFVLDINSTLLDGVFPKCFPVVSAWNAISKDGIDPGFVDRGATYFKGATIFALLEGDASQWLWIHATFIGKAMRNPVGSIGGTTI